MNKPHLITAMCCLLVVLGLSAAQTTATQPHNPESPTSQPQGEAGIVANYPTDIAVDRLFTVSFAIAAFLTAFYTVLRNNSAIRPESSGIFYAIAASVMAGTGFLIAYVLPHSYISAQRIISGTGAACLLGAIVLFLRVTWRSYVRTTFLHEGRGSYKFFILARIWRWARPRRKTYEFAEISRTEWTQTPSGLLSTLMPATFERVGRGGSILVTTDNLADTRAKAIAFALERLRAGDTVNYVTFTTSPQHILASISSPDQALFKHFVFVDAYSRTFGFHDDIVRENEILTKEIGVHAYYAKSCAGIHSALKRAFNYIKEHGAKSMTRRPCLVVYDSLSAFALVDGEEQVNLFLHHMIPSERAYQMVTVLLEHASANEDIRHCMETLVDATIICDSNKKQQAIVGTEKGIRP